MLRPLSGVQRTEGGVTAEHPARKRLPFLVGPSTDDQKNTIRPDLDPVACFRIDDLRFGFESSFLAPGVVVELARLADLREERPGLVASVFGHADPVGDDDFNKALSGRRAKAVYGLLTRDVALWEALFSNPLGEDDWGTPSIQAMLAALGFEPGAFDGVKDDATTVAIRAFQVREGLPETGNPDGGTRALLFSAYMDAICLDSAGSPFALQKSEFLGRGADAQGKADYQGCGELNPVVMFSTTEARAFSAALDKTERDRQNASNRRVVIYLFRPGSRVDPGGWPCPRADEGPSDCQERLWADAPARRGATGARREYPTSKDTFACRFYDRFASRSPCEDVRVPKPSPLIAGRLPSLCSVGRTFPKPSSIPMLREVARLSAADPDLRILIVGHTDRTGADRMNFALSRGRAAAVRAFLLGDAAFFRARFESADPVAKWDWEEIQWMLSAIEIDEDPCYAGFVDGHCSDMTLAALQSFQLSVGIDATHECSEETLGKLIDGYLAMLGDERPAARQIEIVGGGSWHPPRTFGAGSAPVDDLLASTDALPGFRRVEVFLGKGPFRPPTKACATGRHAACSAYEAWCAAATSELESATRTTMVIRIVDVVGQPLSDLGVDLFETAEEEGDTLVGSLTTTHYGLLRLTAPPGLYVLRFSVGGVEHRAGFYIYTDEVGGMTVRLSQSRDQLGHGRSRMIAPSGRVI